MKTKMMIAALAIAGGLISAQAEPVKVIFDTDMLGDFDDVGALACLHALADAGECEILATVSCTRDNYSVAAVEIINAYYARPEIPVGCAKEIGVTGWGPGYDPKKPKERQSHWKYAKLAQDYPQWVKHLNSNDAPDANRVYRKALADSPDNSVVICSVGFITNLRRLLETKGDDISPLDGKALVAKKVKKWVVMACNYPVGEECNSRYDAESSRIAFSEWPTPIVFSDFQYGMDVFAGRAVAEKEGPRNPVKDVFKDNIPSREQIAKEPGKYLQWCFGMPGRSAWDETAVLIAVRGEKEYCNVHRGRYVMIGEDGTNRWEPDEENGPHVRITEKLDKAVVGRIIDELICRPPKNAAAEAVWISGWSKARESAAPVFERDFTLAEKPSEATIDLAVAGWAEISVNGKRIDENVLSPVTCQPDRRLSSIVCDITPFLKAGENRVSVLLGNGWFNCFTKGAWGFETARWHFRDAFGGPSIKGTIKADGKVVAATGADWKVYDSPIVFNALRNGEYYDARYEGQRRNERTAWPEKYPPFGAVSPEDAAPCRQFDPIEPVKDFPAKSGGVIYDFGSNRSGWCEIEVEGEAGAKITLDYDETVKDGELLGHVNFFQTLSKDPNLGQHDEYTLSGHAVEKWHPHFTYHGFRYVRVKTEGKVTLKKIRSVFVHSAFESVGEIEISDPVFTKLQDATRRSYLSNFVGIPTDCPHREKNGWTGDAQLAMETGLWNFDAKAGYTHFLRMILDSQRENGAVPCILPWSDYFGFQWGTGPAWDAILFQIPRQLYRFYGEESHAREAYPAMKKYLKFILSKADAEGLVDYGLGDWCYPKDLMKLPPVKVTDSAYVYWFCTEAAFWAEKFGEKEAAAQYRAEAEKIKYAFNRKFYKGGGMYGDGELAVLAAPLYFKGLCPEGEEKLVAETLVKKVREHKHRAMFGIQGAKWVPRVLADYGYIDDAWRMFTQGEYPGWAKWMETEDTLWEDWDGHASHNHIMYGDLSAWAFEYLAGIKITKPGFAEFEVKPYLPEGVDSFTITHRLPDGREIRVSAKRDQDGRPVYMCR